jgi:molecular chaperone DnaK
MAGDNKSLGRFILDGLPPAPRGVPQIEVTFDIDANGILNVKAQDKATGRIQHITITASSGLAEDEIKNMVKEAEKFAEEDKQRREQQELRNTADNTVYSAEKMLRDYGDKLPEDAKKSTQEKIDAVKKSIESADVDELRRATDDLVRDIQSLGASMYQSGEGEAAGPETGAEDGATPGGEDVVEGEVVD